MKPFKQTRVLVDDGNALRAFVWMPASITTVTITPRGSRGRSAVAIGGKDGAIVFVLTTDRQARKLHIAPYVMGPLVGNADVVERAKHSNGDEDGRAITALGLRHLPVDVVMDLLLKTAH